MLSLAYLVSAGVSTRLVAPNLFNEDDRAYVEGIRAGLRADPRAVLYDAIAPDNVMITWFGERARVSTVVGSAPEEPVFDLPTYALRIVDSSGQLRPISLADGVSDVPTRDRECVHRVTSDRTTRVKLADPSGPGKQVARISYYTAATGFLVVTTPGGAVSLPLRRELNIADLVLQGPIEKLPMRLDGTGDSVSGAAVCVVNVRVGYPTPG